MPHEVEAEQGLEITVKDLKARLDEHDGQDLIVMDVREPHEWYISHLDFARLIPKDDLPDHLNEFDADEGLRAALQERGAIAGGGAPDEVGGFPREESAGRHQCLGAGDRSESAAVLMIRESIHNGPPASDWPQRTNQCRLAARCGQSLQFAATSPVLELRF